MRLLFIGDVVGRAGRDVVKAELPGLKRRLGVDFCVVNGENAAHGIGLTLELGRELLAHGADAVTTGNHVWDRQEMIAAIQVEPRILRPINYPPGTPGLGARLFDAPGGKVLVVNAMGRLFMDALDCPFRAMDDLLKAHILGAGQLRAILLDFHAEATSEKMAMGHHCDGRVSLVVGTHTHVPTADCQILPGGTAYQTDAGMTGDFDSVIGMDKKTPLFRFTRKLPTERLSPAGGPATICGTYVETDPATGLATRVEAVRLGGRLSEAVPAV